jgi:hypothetical protein
MQCDLDKFCRDAASIRLITLIACAGHTVAAVATHLFVPRFIGMVLTDPSKAVANRTLFIRHCGIFAFQFFLQFFLCLKIELLVLA